MADHVLGAFVSIHQDQNGRVGRCRGESEITWPLPKIKSLISFLFRMGTSTSTTSFQHEWSWQPLHETSPGLCRSVLPCHASFSYSGLGTPQPALHCLTIVFSRWPFFTKDREIAIVTMQLSKTRVFGEGVESFDDYSTSFVWNTGNLQVPVDYYRTCSSWSRSIGSTKTTLALFPLDSNLEISRWVSNVQYISWWQLHYIPSRSSECVRESTIIGIPPQLFWWEKS